MKRLLLVVVALGAVGCLRNTADCDAESECFDSEQCVNGECVLVPATAACDLRPCQAEGVDEIGCYDGHCYALTCEPTFSPCDDGCCPLETATSADVLFDEDGVVENPDLVIDNQNRPHVMYSDGTLLRVHTSMWDGSSWKTRPLQITPGATPVFDFDYDPKTGRFWIAYLAFNGEVWIGRSDDGLTWETQRAMTGDPIDPNDPIGFVRLNLSIVEEEPVICALLGNDDLVLLIDRRPGLPTPYLATLDVDGEWQQNTLTNDQSVISCAATFDNSFGLHVAYTVVGDDDVFRPTYAIQFVEGQPFLEQPLNAEFALFGERDAMVVDGKGDVHTVYTQLDQISAAEFRWTAFDVVWSGTALQTEVMTRFNSVEQSDIYNVTLATSSTGMFASFSLADFSQNISTAYVGQRTNDLWEMAPSESVGDHDYFTIAIAEDGRSPHIVWTDFLNPGGLFHYLPPESF